MIEDEKYFWKTELNLTPKEKERVGKFFKKIVLSFLEPVLLGILLGFNSLAWICGIIWLIGNLALLFTDKDTLIIFLCKKLFNI